MQGTELAPDDPPEAAATPAALAAAATAVEALVATRGGMLPDWRGSGREAAWRAELAAAESDTDVARCVATLSRGVAWRRERVLHRGSFHAFTATQHVPLLFPTPGDAVMVLRSGLEAHMEKIRSAVRTPPRVARDVAAAVTASGDVATGGGSTTGEDVRGGTPVDTPRGGAAGSDVRGGTPVDAAARGAGGAAASCNGAAAADATPEPATTPPPLLSEVAKGARPSNGTVSKEEARPDKKDENNMRVEDAAMREEDAAMKEGSTGATDMDDDAFPAPTEAQAEWLKDIDWVEASMEQLQPVEAMTVAAVAYVAGAEAAPKSRCAG